MYRYKINTIYLNDCIKASKTNKNKSGCSVCQNLSLQKKDSIKPLPVNTLLKHKSFGYGTVVSTVNGILNVAFNHKIVSFIFPEAILQGFLTKCESC